LDIAQVAAQLRAFARERDWEKFHTPKNLAASVAIEAAELQEVFQWLTDEQSAALTSEQRASAEREIADVAIYLIRLADQLGIDLDDAVQEKLRDNARRYPRESVHGSAAKRP